MMSETNTTPKVLFVDDEEIFLQLYRGFAEIEKLEASFAADGTAALKILSESPFEIIISDFHMPGMDGVELLQKVRVEYPNVIRVVISGIADYNVLTKAINLSHIFYFLKKPFACKELLQAINDAHIAYNKHKGECHLVP